MKLTSIRAHHQIKESGLITKMQEKVHELIKRKPMTGNELDEIIPGAHKRLSELEKMGVITVMGTTMDSISHKCVNLYCTTGQEPMIKNPAMRKPSRESLQLLVEKIKSGRDMSAFYDKAYTQGYIDAKSGHDLPEDLV